MNGGKTTKIVIAKNVCKYAFKRAMFELRYTKYTRHQKIGFHFGRKVICRMIDCNYSTLTTSPFFELDPSSIHFLIFRNIFQKCL